MRVRAFDLFMTLGAGLMVAGTAMVAGAGPALIVAGGAIWAQTILAAWLVGGA
jgi:hypothetical protein